MDHSPADAPEQLLDRAAALSGIDAEFWDIFGHHHRTTGSAKHAILQALGMRTSPPEALAESLAERLRAAWTRLVPPVLVVSENAPQHQFPVYTLEGATGELQVTLRTENGEVHNFTANLAAPAPSGEAEVDGQRWVSRRVAIPAAVPLGYHDIEVRRGADTGVLRYIVTPDRAWTHPRLAAGRKLAGVAVSLYGVRSARNWGCGDLRDLDELVDWVAEDLDASFLGLNPLHAIHNRRPFNTSPYLPNCTFYQNFIYLDVEAIEDFGNCRRTRALFAQPAVQAELAALRAAEYVEYERVAALKLRFLKLAFCHFLREYRRGSPRADEFRAFVAQEGQLLERFATYCALDEYLHRRDPDAWMWSQWPEGYRDPASAETRLFRVKHWRSVLFYSYVQWQFDRQLARAQQEARQKLAIGLYHDLALATDRFGSDLWAHRSFYVEGCRVGSPPDDFSPSGQDWGFPPPHAEHHRENGYRLYADSIRKNCRHGGALRIDHVMRLFRLYWIPDAADAKQGAYVRERYEDLVRILALESVRNQVAVVGEDLGTVEPMVRETLQRFGVLSYRLFYFEREQGGAFKRSGVYPAQALVSSTTHDLPTITGFWTGADIEARCRAATIDDAAYRTQWETRNRDKQGMLDVLHAEGLLPGYVPRSLAGLPGLTGELHNAIIGFLALTPSQLLCINQEDLTKEAAQQNLPGTTWQYPNWGRRMQFTVHELRTAKQARDFNAMLRHWIGRTGRSNTAT